MHNAAVNKSKRLLISFLCLVFVVSLTGIFVLEYKFSLANESFGREVGKTLLQIISVSVIGTIATLLVSLFHNRRTEAQKEIENVKSDIEKVKDRQRVYTQDKNQFMKNTLEQLNKIYAEVKTTRRLLRAKAFTTPFYKVWNDDTLVLLSIYDPYMEELNNLQLDLEIISNNLQINKSLFKSIDDKTILLTAIEEWLKKIVSEYEEKRMIFFGEPKVLAIGNLNRLKDMMRHKNESSFGTEFFDNYKKLTTSIREEILNLN